jgi:uncharacterized membrane protein
VIAWCSRLVALVQFPRDLGWRKPGFAAMLLGLFLVSASEARAELKVCNQSVTLYNVAIGREKDGKFSTEGWWTLPASTCVTPVKEDLDARYIYVYATTATGDSAFEGNFNMCIDNKRFRIDKAQGQDWDCWVRGFVQVKFKEIDTENASSWTVFIRPNAP